MRDVWCADILPNQCSGMNFKMKGCFPDYDSAALYAYKACGFMHDGDLDRQTWGLASGRLHADMPAANALRRCFFDTCMCASYDACDSGVVALA